MRFRLFPSDTSGPGSYRVLQPYSALEAYGGHDCYMEVDDNPPVRYGDSVPLIFPVPDGAIPDRQAADFYVFQRRLEKWFPLDWPITQRTTFGVVDLIKWLQGNGKAVVVETDDWMHDLPNGAPGRQAIDDIPWLSFDVLRESVKLADVLTVSTPKLAELYRHPNTHVLPNYLHWGLWENLEPVYQRDRKVRVGWMGSFRFRGADLACLNAAGFGAWLERHPDVDFVVVGGDENVHDYLKVPAAQRVTEPYAVYPGHVKTTQAIDIGLVPLEYTVFNECKSHLKGLEYAACGIPCIATPTGPYREWVEPGVNGLLAARPKDWLTCLDEMLENEAWRVMGANARLKASEHTVQKNWQRWEEVFDAYSRPHIDARPARLHEALLPAA